MKNKVLLAISALFGLLFLNSGLSKFFHYMPTPKMSDAAMATFGDFLNTGWLMPLVGIVEVLAGILIVFPKTRALGAIIMIPITVGIFLFHAVQDPGGIGISIALLLINTWIIYENRSKYMHMIS